MSISLILGFALLGFFVIGVPIAFAVGGAAALAILFDPNTPIIIVARRMFGGIDSFPYMALPFFILAGNLMGSGGISKRLVHFCVTIVGRFPGGLALATVLTCMIFAAVSGSGAATAAAAGTILIPGMVANRYEKDFAGATVASAAALGVIIPPSVPMIVFCMVSGANIGKMFLGGIVPGIMLGVSLMLVAFLTSRREGFQGSRTYTAQEIRTAFKDATLALLMPVIILGGIYSGIFTPTEAASVAVMYGFIVSTFVYKELKAADIKKILLNSAITAASILLIISTASLMGMILTREKIPGALANIVLSLVNSKIVFILLLNALLLVVGMLMEAAPAITLLTPILAPIALGFGMDLTHFGLIVVINLAIGLTTPPVGLTLFVACDLAGVKVKGIVTYLWKYIAIMIADLLLISFIPEISMWLPNLYRG